jgi:hypothetical protein
MNRWQRPQQRGQILVFSALLMAFFFVPLAILVIDTGLLEAGYAQLTETVQTAAEDGASMVDEGLYRSSNGQAVHLDAMKARTIADQALTVSHLAGLGPWQIAVQGDQVTVHASEKVQLFVLGVATITTTKSARLAYGP